MRFAGEGSWRLAVSAGSSLHALLWLRDALALDVPGDDMPPALVDVPPDRSDTISASDRPGAAVRWARWWREQLAVEAAEQLVESPSAPEAFAAWVGRSHEARQRAGAPPDFAALSDVPALQRAASQLYREVREHVDRRERTLSASAPPASPPSAISARDVVAAVADEQGVSPGALRAAVLVLDAEGVWWRAVAPGTVACTADCLEDSTHTEAVLRAAFLSGLRGPRGA